MDVYEILKGQLYQSGAPQDAADWQPVHDLGIDVVVDLFGTLDAGVPMVPNTILYIFWPIADIPELPDTRILDVLVDAIVRLIRLEHKVLVHCHMGKSRSGLFNALVAMKILGISGAEAVDLVRRRRPGSLGNQVFAAYLQSLPAPGRPEAAHR